MYTVFVNDKPIFLSNEPISGFGHEVYHAEEIRFEEVLHKLRHTSTAGICIYHQDLEKLWNAFKKYFKVIQAAGGLVIKNDRALLCIFRNKQWDLPKGKMEQGENPKETALREVEEECGVKELKIKKKLQITYHIFHEGNSNRLKITHWFLMTTTDSTIPTPQKEEGITLAQYISLQNIPDLYTNMYANISELIHNYLNQI